MFPLILDLCFEIRDIPIPCRGLCQLRLQVKRSTRGDFEVHVFSVLPVRHHIRCRTPPLLLYLSRQLLVHLLLGNLPPMMLEHILVVHVHLVFSYRFSHFRFILQ
jgi:hypothetical protein